MATLGVPDPRTLTIQAWDASAMQSIEKAIQNSGLGLNPVNDGTLIRINIPTLSEERRCDLVKIVKKHGEDCKVSIRNARRDANEEIKQAKKTSAITEDDERNNLEEIQKTTDAYIKKIDEAVKQKEQDIMKV
jgi:ribosome recycling factor